MDPIRTLRQLFDSAGVGWALEGDAEAGGQRILRELEATEAEYERRLSRPLSPRLFEQLVAEREALEPLIQAFAAPISAPIRVMIYCVLKGADIRRVSYRYEQERHSLLAIDIELPSGQALRFESDEFWDTEVLRHFGMTKRGGRPVLEGYYAFRRG